MVDARIADVRERERGLYEAEIDVSYGGHTYKLKISRLVRKPASLKASLRGEYLIIELYDDNLGIIATCCIHKGHLERGCMECPSLIPPPR
jgi:hypothetical protein